MVFFNFKKGGKVERLFKEFNFSVGIGVMLSLKVVGDSSLPSLLSSLDKSKLSPSNGATGDHFHIYI